MGRQRDDFYRGGMNFTFDQMQKDLKFTTNALMRFQYGEWAVED